MSLFVKFLAAFSSIWLLACSPVKNSYESKHEFVPFPTKKIPPQRAAKNSAAEHADRGTRDIGLPSWAQGQNSFQLLLASLTKDQSRNNSAQKVLSYLALFDPTKDHFPTFLEQEVNALVEILKTNPSYQVELFGSADVEETQNNPDVSSLIEKRTEAVKAELEARGIEGKRISIIDGHERGRIDTSDQRLLRSVRANLSIGG